MFLFCAGPRSGRLEIRFRLTTFRSIAAVMLVAAVWLYFSSGFWTSKRVSDDVMIDNAIDYVLSHQVTRIYGSSTDKDGRREETKVIPYTSKGGFLADNPDCCTFRYRDPEFGLPSRFYRIRYGYGGMVYFHYMVHGTFAGKPVTHQLSRIIYMNRDGTPLPDPG